MLNRWKQVGLGVGDDQDFETLIEGESCAFPLYLLLASLLPPLPTYYKRMQRPCYEIMMTSTPLTSKS